MNTPHKILIVAPSWVGDMVMAQSLLIALKRQQPQSQIDILAPAWILGLLERMPEITKVIPLTLTHGQFSFNERKRLGENLRAEQYQQAIVLPNSWKSALIPYFAKIPLRTGYIGECRWGLLNDARKLNKHQLPLMVQRFVSLANKTKTEVVNNYPVPQLVVSTAQQQAVIAKYQLNITANTVLALCAGAEYGSAKRWSAEYFARVANYHLAQGGQVWLFGSTKDQTISQQINQLTQNRCHDFAGRTQLAEAVDLLSLANSVISNDSGLMHVSAALNKKLIALYGSSDARFTPPLTDKAQIVSLNLPCSPCFKRECPLGHTHCLTQLTPDKIIPLLHEKYYF